MKQCTHFIIWLTFYALLLFRHSWSVWWVWFRWAVVWMQWPPGLHRRPLTLLHLGAILNACYGYSKQVQISTDRYDLRCTLDPCLRTVVNWIVKFSSLTKQLVKCVYSSFTWEHLFWSGAHKQVIPQSIQTMEELRKTAPFKGTVDHIWLTHVSGQSRAVWEVKLRLIPSRRIALQWGQDPHSVLSAMPSQT